MSDLGGQVHEESVWFGSERRRLFGRLTTPTGGWSKGGVLISPPIGREMRVTRRALRSLAIYLAIDGYTSLRFDHFGTGDSSGSIEDDQLDQAWIEGVDQGVALLRSMGPEKVSAVGMRMGATVLGTAALASDLGLSSFVMWDPCESGRAYARELTALAALRQDSSMAEVDEETRMLEYDLSDEAASRVSLFDLRLPWSRPVADRALVVVREDRPVSRAFKERWSAESSTWITTSEQSQMLEMQLPTAVQPAVTIARILSWLTDESSEPTAISMPALAREAIVAHEPGALAVRETALELGRRGMFGVVSEPVGDAQGPLMVMVNGFNEDHLGPARLWVELSRRWAGLGLRCVRFDLSELGESPWQPGQPERDLFDKTRSLDIADAMSGLNPANPGDSVLIGYCSGAQLALKVALEVNVRGVCAVNPEIGARVFRNVDRLRQSEHDSAQLLVQRIEALLRRHRSVDRVLRQISHFALSLAYPPKVPPALARNDTETLLLLSPEDLSPMIEKPIFGAFLRRRLICSEHLRVEVVPGMDHAILSTIGRNRAVDILDRHVVQKFIHAAPKLDVERTEVNES